MNKKVLFSDTKTNKINPKLVKLLVCLVIAFVICFLIILVKG